MPQPAFPHEMRHGPHEQDPAGLDGERFHHLGAAQAFHEDRDRAKQFVVEWQPFHRRLDTGRHDIDGEHLAAEEIFEGVNDEHDRGDLENPERHERDRVGDKKLNERSHEQRSKRAKIGDGMGRQREVIAKVKQDRRDRRNGHGGENEPAAQEDAEPVSEIA